MNKRILAVGVALACLPATQASYGAILDLWTFEGTFTPSPQSDSDFIFLSSGGAFVTGFAGQGVQANTGFELILNLTGITGPFQITYKGQSGEAGAVSQQWSYSLNGGGSYTVLGTQPSALGTGIYSSYTVNFSDALLNNNPGVRIKDDLTGGRGNFDNLQLAAVPEPINVALAVFGICVAGAGVGRRVYSRAKA